MACKNFEYYNANPKGYHVCDCVIRALSKATGLSWENVMRSLAGKAADLGQMPNVVTCYSPWLKENHFVDGDTRGMTVNQLVNSYPSATIVARTMGHLVCVKDGKYWDTWDCGRRKVIQFWIKEDVE